MYPRLIRWSRLDGEHGRVLIEWDDRGTPCRTIAAVEGDCDGTTCVRVDGDALDPDVAREVAEESDREQDVTGYAPAPRYFGGTVAP